MATLAVYSRMQKQKYRAVIQSPSAPLLFGLARSMNRWDVAGHRQVNVYGQQ